MAAMFMSVPVSNSMRTRALSSLERDSMLFMLLSVPKASSSGRVISRSTSSGDEEGYGTLTFRDGKDMSGRNISGSLV